MYIDILYIYITTYKKPLGKRAFAWFWRSSKGNTYHGSPWNLHQNSSDFMDHPKRKYAIWGVLKIQALHQPAVFPMIISMSLLILRSLILGNHRISCQWIHPQVLGKVLGPAARGAVQSLPLARGWHHSLVLPDLTFGRTESSGNSWKFDGNYWLARAKGLLYLIYFNI